VLVCGGLGILPQEAPEVILIAAPFSDGIYVDKAVKKTGKTVRVWLGLKYTGTLGNYSEGVAVIPSPDILKP
jgi:hypothetical protein